MARVMLDTDILSEVFKGKQLAVSSRAIQYRAEQGHLTTSVISVMEVVKGFQKLRQPTRIEAFLSRIAGDEVLEFDLASARIAGAIYADLEIAGQTIGRADPMVAAIAIRHALPLVTGNVDHYQRVQALGYSLVLDNWRD